MDDRTNGVTDDPKLQKMVEDLRGAAGDRLLSVVLYGSAARGDFQKATSDWNLILVLRDLSPDSLESIAAPLARWRKQRQPMPRLFSPETIAESADVFPVEFLDLKRSRVVVHGEDPFAEIEVHRDHLRLQCERELREKMMRLREGYIEAADRPKELGRLLTDSYGTFVALFRGCLDLLGEEVPVHNDDVVTAFCEKADLDRTPFERVSRLKAGKDPGLPPKTLFSTYYDELTKAVHRVNRFEPGGETR